MSKEERPILEAKHVTKKFPLTKGKELIANDDVSLKFYKGQFQFYDKQIAQQNDDGTKTVLEKSWFQRGNKLLITGFRRGENFVPRQYKDSIFKHSVQMIKDINDDGSLQLISDRVEVDGSDEQ